MSNVQSITGTNEPSERTDPADVIEEHRDLFERIANTDLNSAEYCQRALDYADKNSEGDDGE